jgi:aldehyde dehydrogenase
MSVVDSQTVGGVEVPSVPTELFIGGEWRAASDDGSFEVVAPASEEHLATVASASAADVDAAVAAARAQADGGAWATMHGADKGILMNRLADAMERDLETFATLEALDVGRPAMEPRLVDIPHAIDVIRHFAGWADKIEGRWVTPQPMFGAQRQAFTLREPLGVIGAITAWNAPALIASWKLGPALAAGNAVVLKPAEEASLSTLHLAKLIEEVGFPPGTVNVIPGLGETAGAALVRHPGIDKLSFTGSPEVGREIAIEAARLFRPVTLELGGKSPNIFFADVADADDDFFDKALEGFAMFALNQGEVCTCPSRVLVQESIYDKFMDRAVARTKKIKQGHPLDATTMIGAQASNDQLEKILSYLDIGKQEGAKVLTGGKRATLEGELAEGYYVEPTIFEGHNKMRVFQEEIFGPVVSVTKFKNEEDALSIANDTLYGLGAGVWTRNGNRAYRFGRAIQAGRVWTNCYHAYPAHAAFGGYKQSGIGRETHKMMLDHYQQTKNVLVSYSTKALGFF